MLANCPPLGSSQVQTRGGTYSLLSLIAVPFQPGTAARKAGACFPVSAMCPCFHDRHREERSDAAIQSFDCLKRALGKEAGQRAVPLVLDILDDRRTAGCALALAF